MIRDYDGHWFCRGSVNCGRRSTRRKMRMADAWRYDEAVGFRPMVTLRVRARTFLAVRRYPEPEVIQRRSA